MVAAGSPKLDQFPSPQPLSEQEKILTNYVAQYPEHAVLIARATSSRYATSRGQRVQATTSRLRTVSQCGAIRCGNSLLDRAIAAHRVRYSGKWIPYLVSL